MCAHSSSCEAITQEIEFQLYPSIRVLLDEIGSSSSIVQFLAVHHNLNDTLNLLKSEFESLSNYETKLVFPTVLRLFNTKHLGAERPSANVRELINLTRKKEIVIDNLIDDMQIALQETPAPNLDLFDRLADVFRLDFKQKKQEWMAMLQGWSGNCACFMAATQLALNKHSDENQ